MGKVLAARLAMAVAAITVLVAWAGVGAGQAVPTEPAATATTLCLFFCQPATTTTTVAKTTTTVHTTTTAAHATTTTTTKPGASTTTTTTVSPAQVRAMEALANSVRRSAPNNDTALITALQPLQALGDTQQQALIAGMGQFPVAGPASWTDDWLEYRATPSPHNHMGIDLAAAMGTPIRSPIAGTLEYNDTDPDGYGMTAIVTGPDKTYYLLAHMSATVPGLKTGSAVTQGEVVGYVGDSGDATGPHLHFEVHPNGGNGIDGKPDLDAWVTAAIKAVPALITSIKNSSTTTSTTTTLAPLQVAQPASRGALSPPQILTARPATAKHPTIPALTALGALLVCVAVALLRYGTRASPARSPKALSPEPAPPT